MKKNFKQILAMLLALVMVLGMVACGNSTPVATEPAATEAPAAAPTEPAVEEPDTLVIGTQNFDGKFSPFFYTNAYENDVLSLVNVGLLGTDREGAVVLMGMDGETRPYNGTDYVYDGIANCVVTENSDGTVY